MPPGWNSSEPRQRRRVWTSRWRPQHELPGQEERVRAAEQLSAQRNDDLELLRRELGSARRDFLIQNQRARSAETRVDELGAELRSVRVELEAELRSVRVELEAEIAAARAELEAARADAEEPPRVPCRTAAELSAALEAGERAMVQIMDGARGRAAEELREAERACREILAEIERLTAWRDRLAPLVGAVRSSIEDARGRAAGIGDRVDEAVDPLS
ncbi:MAG TPA: hypothetical protein VGA93_00300 [Actinomycetota bacterium]